MSEIFPRIESPPTDDLTGIPSPPPAPPPPASPGFPPPPSPYPTEPSYRPVPAGPTVAGLAIASLVLGILWIWWIGSVLAVIFGHIALSQIRRSNGWKTGRGMAIAGVVLGWLGIATLVTLIALAILGAATGDDPEPSATARSDGSGQTVDDPSVLNGAYRAQWSVDDLVAAGVPEDTVHQFNMAGSYTWELDDGDLEFTSRFPDGSRSECAGTYSVVDDVVNLRLQSPCPRYSFTATWTLSDTELVFHQTLLNGEPDPFFDIWMSQKPWTQVG